MARSSKYAQRKADLKKYGILPEDYARMLRAQGFGCAICGIQKCPSGRRFSVDHCHETGRVRGILCLKCNQGIGQLDDSPERLRRAAEYLEKGLTPDLNAGTLNASEGRNLRMVSCE